MILPISWYNMIEDSNINPNLVSMFIQELVKIDSPSIPSLSGISTKKGNSDNTSSCMYNVYSSHPMRAQISGFRAKSMQTTRSILF